MTNRSAYSTANVNVRTGPSTSNSKLGGLTKGQRVGVIAGEPGRGWVEIVFNNAPAFVSGKFLSNKRPKSVSLPKAKRKGNRGETQDQLLIAVQNISAETQASEEVLSVEMDGVEALLR